MPQVELVFGNPMNDVGSAAMSVGLSSTYVRSYDDLTNLTNETPGSDRRAAFEMDDEGDSSPPKEDAPAGYRSVLKGALFRRQYNSGTLSVVGTMFSKSSSAGGGDGGLTDADYKRVWFGLLHPHATLRRMYNGMHITILLYFLYILPKRLGFGLIPHGVEAEIDVVIDLIIFVDIIINFWAYYFDKRNMLVTDAKKIRRHYLKSWFPIDFLAIIPADQVCKLVAEQLNLPELEAWASTIRLTRLLRIFRLAKLPVMLQIRTLKKDVVDLLKPFGLSRPLVDFVFTVGFLVCCLLTAGHTMGCLWAHRGFYENGSHTKIVGGGWMAAFYGGAGTGSSSGASAEASLPSVEHIYTDVVYFTLVTMTSVGYGDILSITNSERSLNIVMIVVGGFLYAFIIGSFGSMVNNMGHDEAQFDIKMRSVSALLKFYKAPKDMEDRVLDFFALKYNTHVLFPDDNDFLEQLPASLHDEVILHRFEDTVQKIPFLVGVREDVVVALCTCMKSVPFVPGNKVMTAGTMYRKELVIIARGVVTTTNEGVDHEHNVGTYFGELEFLGVSDRRAMTVVARVYVETSTLHPDDIDEVLRRHPFLQSRLQRYGEVRQQAEMMITSGEKEVEEIQEFLSISAKEVQAMNEPFQASDEMKEKMLLKIWARVDKDGNGTLEPNEVLDVLLQMGLAKKQVPSDGNGKSMTEIQTLKTLVWEGYDGKVTSFSDMDDDGNGKVELDEFRKWYFAQSISDPTQDESYLSKRHHDTVTHHLEHIEDRLDLLIPAIEEIRAALPTMMKLAKGQG